MFSTIYRIRKTSLSLRKGTNKRYPMGCLFFFADTHQACLKLVSVKRRTIASYSLVSFFARASAASRVGMDAVNHSLRGFPKFGNIFR
jgi:hypothetical protein